MNCERVAELLPWLANGTLDPAEAGAVRAHITECARCRAEQAETARAARVYGAHLPVEVLVDLAWGRAPEGLDAALAERHLAACPECADELALARESRSQEETPVLAWPSPPAAGPVDPAAGPVPGPAGEGPTPAVRRFSLLPLAAALPVAFLLGWWAASGRVVPPVASPGPDPAIAARIASLEAEVGRLRAAAEAAVAAGARLAAPQLNLPVFELLPAGLVQRSAGGGPKTLEIPEDAAFVALLLNSEHPAARPARVRIVDEQGRAVWEGEGLRPGPLGGYSLAVPAALLPDGRYAVVVAVRGAADERYPLAVRRRVR